MSVVATVRANSIETGRAFVVSFAAPLEPWSARLRTHNQNRTVAARAIADMKTFGHLS